MLKGRGIEFREANFARAEIFVNANPRREQ
jgi:hypothetical protein